MICGNDGLIVTTAPQKSAQTNAADIVTQRAGAAKATRLMGRVRMKRIRTGVISLALSSVVLNATAAELCATAQDLTAMQVAAVQQKLMVAALSCNDSTLYNDFVAAYQPDLVASDLALQAFFMRLNADTGASDYDAFKTKLANNYSITSSKNTRGYCVSARTTFKTALAANRPTLRTFVLSQPMAVDKRYGVCGETVAGGELHMGAAAPVIAAAETPANSAEVAITAAANVASAKAAETSVTAAANVASAEAAETAVTAAANLASAKAAQSAAAAAAQAPAVTASRRDDNLYRYPNGSAPQQQPARRYDARDPRDPYARDPYARPYYQQGYGDGYGYTNRYGDRDPYYRNPYARPYYGRVRPAPPPDYYYYLRRR